MLRAVDGRPHGHGPIPTIDDIYAARNALYPGQERVEDIRMRVQRIADGDACCDRVTLAQIGALHLLATAVRTLASNLVDDAEQIETAILGLEGKAKANHDDSDS